MNRRNFLGLIAGAPVATAVVPTPEPITVILELDGKALATAITKELDFGSYVSNYVKADRVEFVAHSYDSRSYEAGERVAIVDGKLAGGRPDALLSEDNREVR